MNFPLSLPFLISLEYFAYETWPLQVIYKLVG